MNKLLKYLVPALFMFFFSSCSKDDNPADSPVGGEAYKLQIVTLDLPNTDLSEAMYEGVMGSVELSLVRGEDHQLTFMIPPAVALGQQVLNIPALGLNVNYNIKETVLADTPAATVAPLVANLNTFQATASGNEASQKAINSFNQAWDNATDAEKEEFAQLYQLNKPIIDNLILNDFSNLNGKDSNNGVTLLVKHQLGVLSIATGVALVTLPSTVATIDKVAGALFVTIGAIKSYDYFVAFAQLKINTIGLYINQLLGTNDRQMSLGLQLQNDVASVLPLSTLDRTVTAEDSGKQNGGIVQLFTYHNLYNSFAQQVNPVIQWLNSNVPFVDINLIPLEIMPTDSAASPSPIDAATFAHLSLSVNHPNLSLVSSTLSASGELMIKIKITGTPSIVPVASTLNYSYSDQFNTFSGTFPISVSTNNAQTVTIGTQTWMLKNLDVTTYRNGDPIPQVSDPTQWANLTTGAWCYYANNTENGVVYGKLYNWYAVNDPRGLAPTGYHVPSDAEWSLLVTSLGGESVAGGKMKEAGTAHWSDPNTDANNISGFTGLPGGVRNLGGPFLSMGYNGIYWSSTEKDATNVWTCLLGYSQANAVITYYSKNYGLSVRCIKD